MFLKAFSDNSFQENCWLLAADGSREAVVVDPGFSPGKVRAMLEEAGKEPVAVLATHGHHDHVGAAAEFCGEELPFFIHPADRLALVDARRWGAGYDSRTVIAVKDVRAIEDGDVLRFAGFEIRVVHTPGHTPGSVSFLTDGWALTGDLVFRGTIGRYDFPNSSWTDMQASLKTFLSWPDELPVHPGHGPSTTVGRERAKNPHLRDR